MDCPLNNTFLLTFRTLVWRILQVRALTVVSCCGIFPNPSRQYSKHHDEMEKCLDEGLEPTYYFSIFDISLHLIIKCLLSFYSRAGTLYKYYVHLAQSRDVQICQFHGRRAVIELLKSHAFTANINYEARSVILKLLNDRMHRKYLQSNYSHIAMSIQH